MIALWTDTYDPTCGGRTHPAVGDFIVVSNSVAEIFARRGVDASRVVVNKPLPMQIAAVKTTYAPPCAVEGPQRVVRMGEKARIEFVRSDA